MRLILNTFNNQVAVIIRAASGLGLVAAKKLSAEGMELALPDAKTDLLEAMKNGRIWQCL